MRAISLDLRERIVAACEAGASQTSVATRFGVCAKTVSRLRARAAAGQLARAPIVGRRASLTAEQEESLKSLLNEDVNWTVDQVCQVWQQRTGQHVPRSTMHDAMRRVGARFKKKSHRQRAQCREKGGVCPPDRRAGLAQTGVSG